MVDVAAFLERFLPNSRRLRALEKEIFSLRGEIANLKQTISEGDDHVLQTVFDSVRRTSGNQQPNLNPLTLILKHMATLRWNSKILGASIAKGLYQAGLAGPTSATPSATRYFGLTSKLCCQSDIESEWVRYWCGQLKMAPIYSRKIWEYGYVLQAAWEAGVLAPGRKALGFAVGNEPTPAFLASLGIEVLATDLEGDDGRSDVWRDTGQHATSAERLYRPEYLKRSDFDGLCSFMPVDMNHIPSNLDNRFDFCWSMCSFEHVGSIELGLQFVENSIKCLKPGGVAVHTTEYSFDQTDETIDSWPIVLFQKKHIAELAERLSRNGHELLPVNYDPGSDILDSFIDGPPYAWDSHPHLKLPDSPHLRLDLDGFACSSIGLIIRRGTT